MALQCKQGVRVQSFLPSWEAMGRFVPLLATLALVVGGLYLIDRSLRRRWQTHPDAQFRFQLIMLALTLAGGLGVVLALPISESLKGQLLSLIGVLLSAAIALSATTFIGNILAGIMLRAIRSARPGDFITVAAITGRVTEMDLLHTEVQTEDSDLVTVPNLFLVTQPMKVVRASGTIVSAEVSLGYDLARTRVTEVLLQAAQQAGLGEGFVHVRALGDFSVNYRVAGMLGDVGSLISARSRLRECMLDALHGAGIEIVSPNFMNTRALEPGAQVIPAQQAAAPPAPQEDGTTAEEVAFEKADEAASIEHLRDELRAVETQLEQAGGGAASATLEQRKSAIEARIAAAQAHQQAEKA